MLTDIDTWVLDLDNTLYPPSTGLADQLNTRIREYLRDFFDTDDDGARRLQSTLIAEHGTTLRGLMTTQGIDPADYLAFEHRIGYVPGELPEVRRAVFHRRVAGGDVRRSRAQPRRTPTVGDGNDLGHVSRPGRSRTTPARRPEVPGHRAGAATDVGSGCLPARP
jgi:hypothetical protein